MVVEPPQLERLHRQEGGVEDGGQDGVVPEAVPHVHAAEEEQPDQEEDLVQVVFAPEQGPDLRLPQEDGHGDEGQRHHGGLDPEADEDELVAHPGGLEHPPALVLLPLPPVDLPVERVGLGEARVDDGLVVVVVQVEERGEDPLDAHSAQGRRGSGSFLTGWHAFFLRTFHCVCEVLCSTAFFVTNLFSRIFSKIIISV